MATKAAIHETNATAARSAQGVIRAYNVNGVLKSIDLTNRGSVSVLRGEHQPP